ncbi:MAG: 50S ribosomal protein L4 [Dehalococcoidia bacterium]|nr:50S ribosomal protein L4 [Dehalococcoidia bacterium]
MKLEVRDSAGKKVKSIDVDDQVFGLEPRRSVVHQALLAQRANQRQGTHKTKTRGEVRGSTAKLFRQKGTGRARQGSIRAPHRRGGGVAFGPRPRSYRQDLPKRMRRLAIRSALSAKAANGSLQVIDKLSIERPRTKDLEDVLQRLGFERTTLVVTAEPDNAVKLSLRNLPRAKWLPAAYLNVVDLLSHRGLLMTEEAVRAAEALWGGERATRRRAPAEVSAGA